MKKLTFMFVMLLMGVLSFAQGETDDPQLVVLPDGVTTEDYVFTATKQSGFSSSEVERTVKVGFNGNDVYVQGMSGAESMANVWVKGTLNGDNITFAKGQLMFKQDFGFMVITSYFNAPNDVVFAYDASNNKMTCAEGYGIGSIDDEGTFHAEESYYNVVISQGGGEDNPPVVVVNPFENPLIITPADGAECEKLDKFTVDFVNSPGVMANTVDPVITLVNTDTNEEATFYGMFEDFFSPRVYSIEFDPAVTAPGTYLLTIGEGVFYLNDNTEIQSPRYVCAYTIKGEDPVDPEEPELVTLPEGVTAEAYDFTATKLASGFGLDEDVTRTVQVGFDGNDVYVQGLSADLPEAWVKGVVNGENIIFAKEQVLSVITITNPFFGGTTTTTTAFNPDNDVVFAYDAANNRMTCADGYNICGDAGDGYHANERYTNVVIAKEGGSTPEEPTVVTLPEGVNAVDYTMTATTLKNYNRVDVNRVVKVGVDGVDVYIQGLAECLPEAWVKGVLTGTDVVFEGGQLLGDNNGFDATFEPDHATITFAYDAEADKYTISAYELQAGSYTWEQYSDVVLAGDNGTVGPGDDPQPQEDFTISPAEDEQLTSLGTFVITFNNYTVTAFMGEATAKLTNTTTEQQEIVAVEVSEDGKTATMNFTETTEPGVYTLQVMDLYKGDYEFLDETLVFNYEIAGYVEPLAWTVEPAAGEVTEIEAVSVKFNKNVTVDSGAMAYLFKGDDELQAKSLLPGEDYVLAIFDKVTEAGEYQMVIPEGITTVDGEAVPEIAVNYTVKGSVEPKDDWTISPEGKVQESLSEFTVTFNNYAVSNTFDEVATLVSEQANYSETAEMVMNEDNTVITLTFPETTAPGEYTLTVPGLFVSGEGRAIDDIVATYTIEGYVNPVEYTIDPEQGEVESLKDFTITFNNYLVDVTEDAQAFLMNTGTETEMAASLYAISGGQSVYVVLDEEVTAAGSYELIIMDGSIQKISDETFLSELSFSYTIPETIEPLPDYVMAPEGTVQESLSTFTLTFNNFEVGLDAYEAVAMLSGGSLEEPVKAALSLSDDHKVVTMTFDEITAPGDYLLTIAEGAIFNRTTFADLPEMSWNYTILSEAQELTWSIDPEEGDVEVLYTFAINFEGGLVDVTEEAEAFLFNTESETEVPASLYAINGGMSVYVVLDEEVTAPGSYELIIMDGSIQKTFDDTFLPELSFSYTIVGSGPALAIQSAEAVGEDGAVYFDAMGRRTNGQAKGLLLKQVRDANGNVKTVKVARK